MPLRSAALACLLALFAIVGQAHAQTTRPGLDAAEISVLTFGPGPLIFERFGHVAVRVHAPGLDVCFDWGNFSFDDPGFIWRFVRGDNRYWMQGKPTNAIVDFYVTQLDRTVIERRLALTPEQKRRLIGVLSTQDDEDHRFYNYDYYRDNCATRVRDLIDVAVEGQLHEQSKAPPGPSYHWQTRRLLWSGLDNKVLVTLMDFLAGPRTDAPLSPWDGAFLPNELGKTLDAATVDDGQGGRRPLVSEKRVVNQTQLPANAEPATPGAIWLAPTLIGFVGAALLLLAARWARWLFATIAVAWELFAAFGGALMLFMIGFTHHWPVAWNENLLQFSPLGLAVILAVAFRRLRPPLRWAATASAALSLLGAVIALSHLTPQHNAPAIGLALPMHLAVWFGLNGRRTAPSMEGTVA